MTRNSAKQSARTLWRTISTNLMDAELRAALFVAPEGDEGEAQAALLACRAAVAEGFNVCLVVADSSGSNALKCLAEVGDGTPALRFLVAGHDIVVEKGRNGEPDILRLRLEGSLLRDMITHVDAPRSSNAGDLRDQLLARLNESYAIAIVLGGAVLSDPYSLVFADRVPGVILVLRAGRARARDAERAKSLVEAAGGNILGSVMTHRRTYLPGWLARRL